MAATNNIAGLREQILANAQLLFIKTFKAHDETRWPPFNIAIFQRRPSTATVAAGPATVPTTLYQAILYYTSSVENQISGESIAEGSHANSEEHALRALLGLLSRQLGMRQYSVLFDIDRGDRVEDDSGGFMSRMHMVRHK